MSGATTLDFVKAAGKGNKPIAVTESPAGEGNITPQYTTPVAIGAALAEGADGRFADAAHVHTADAGVVTFTPNDLSDWTGSADPGNTNDALNQLAQRETDHVA